MRMHGVDDAPSVDDSAATFEDVDGADGVTYTATPTGLKEDVLLESAPRAGETLSYAYSLNASSGLTPTFTDDGEIDFRNQLGSTLVTIPRASMTDSAGDPAFSDEISYDLTKVGDGWKLTVTPNMSWLTAADRVYPVTIDPSLTGNTTLHDCFIGSSDPTDPHCGNGTTYVKVGRSDASHKYRGLMDFDVSDIPLTATVTAASVNMTLNSSQTFDTTKPADYGLSVAGKTFDNNATLEQFGCQWVMERRLAGLSDLRNPHDAR
jgi:hypothetical protein